jgi:hypothetical protein
VTPDVRLCALAVLYVCDGDAGLKRSVFTSHSAEAIHDSTS